MDESKETKSETKKEKNLEVKKEKDTKGNKWIIQTLAVISGILLILLICDAALGNGVFSWLNKSQTPEITPIAEGYNGLLAGSLTGYSINTLENYEVMYNAEGKLIYEIINNGNGINIGEGYKVTKDGRDSRTLIIAFSQNSLQQKYLTCGCVGPKCLSSAKDPCRITGEENFVCEGTYTLGDTEGNCRFVPKSWI
jgi:hypothetical protein